MLNRGMVRHIAILLLVTLLAACAAMPQPETAPVTPGVSGAPVPQAEARTGQGTQDKPKAAEKSEVLPANPEESIFFSPGSSAIASSERVKLKLLAGRLLNDRRQSVTLVGYAANQGSRSLNLAIADARIGAVANALKKQGVSTYQIRRQVSGAVKSDNCRSSECWRLMRRVDLVFPEAVGSD